MPAVPPGQRSSNDGGEGVSMGGGGKTPAYARLPKGADYRSNPKKRGSHNRGGGATAARQKPPIGISIPTFEGPSAPGIPLSSSENISLDQELLPRDNQSPPDFTPHQHLMARNPSTKMCGRDPKTGKVLPHKRNPRTATIVAQYTANGASENEIAVLLNIRPGQLRSDYAHELTAGLSKANMEVASTVFKQAKKPGNMRASEFWLKTRAGWRDGEQKPIGADALNIHIHL